MFSLSLFLNLEMIISVKMKLLMKKLRASSPFIWYMRKTRWHLMRAVGEHCRKVLSIALIAGIS